MTKELHAYLYSVSIGSNGVTFAVGQSNVSVSTSTTINPIAIYLSAYSGAGLGEFPFWEKIPNLPSAVSAQLWGVDTRDGVRAVAVGTGGMILYTNNSGLHWYEPRVKGAALCPGSTLYGVSLAADGSSVVAAAGSAACVLISNDFGRSWARVSSPLFEATTNFRFKSVDAVRWDIIYLTGSKGRILRTLNGGVSWEVDYSKPSAFYSITMHDFVSFQFEFLFSFPIALFLKSVYFY